ncbi:MAG: outer membrane beta-barrel protein [Flavobacteriaceae bacterium]|nr:outer membrane beta-barrel protein [Flavobacteriaceae bacterium]
MANKKDIGRAYKEQLETYKVSPHNRVWDRIEEELDKKENKRVTYWKFVSGGLLLLLLLSSTFYFLRNTNAEQSKEHKNVDHIHSKNKTSLEKKPKPKQEITTTNITNTSLKLGHKTLEQSHKNSSQSSTSKKHTTSKTSKYTSNSNQVYSTYNIEPYSIINMQLLTYSSLINIAKTEKNFKKNNHKDSRKHYIKTSIGANHFSTLKNGSAIDESLKNNSIKSEISITYGIALGYDLSKHSSISFGMQYSKLSTTTKAADSTNLDSTLKYSHGYQNINLDNSINSYAALGSLSEIDFKQQLTYLEFPLQYYYTPSKSNLQLTFFGGVSFLALLDDTITAESSNGNSIEIGTANNLSKLSMSLSIGSGLNYLISDKLKLHIEPTFKYYLNTYNRNNSINPFSINFNLGMSYKF